MKTAPAPAQRRRLKLALSLVFAGLASLPATSRAMSAAPAGAEATPRTLYPAADNWQEWGSGEMRFFGFRLYRATLWVAGASIDDIRTAPHALSLHYSRDIARDRLVSASLDEMRRLGADEAALGRWKLELERVFPDVREGERIIGLHLPGLGARFFHQGRPTGEVMDTEFARRFFAIWLDPRTRSPEVRALLLKRPGGGG